MRLNNSTLDLTYHNKLENRIKRYLRLAVILDGKKVRDKILADLKTKIENLPSSPSLAVILVGDDPASQIYVNNKKKTAEKLGITSQVIKYPAEVSEETIILKIKELNEDITVNAILVQLPLPKHISKQNVINSISPDKDVDCFTSENYGKLALGLEPAVYPCTPKGILLLLDEYGIDLDGKHVVVVGRSNLVGKPMSLMALKRNATVTTCHSHTKNLKEITKTADILISAVGEVLIEENMVCEDSVVIDVGIFRDGSGKIRGDVDFEKVAPVVSFISPVPGGIGPMTIASLMLNTYELFLAQNERSLQ